MLALTAARPPALAPAPALALARQCSGVALPEASAAHRVLALQRAAGNRAVSQLVARARATPNPASAQAGAQSRATQTVTVGNTLARNGTGASAAKPRLTPSGPRVIARKPRQQCEVAILLLQGLHRGVPLGQMTAGLEPRTWLTAVQVELSLLRAIRALIYWQRVGCMYLAEDGPEIVRPCPPVVIAGWLPDLFAELKQNTSGAGGDAIGSLCPKTPGFLPTIPKEYKELMDQTSAPSQSAPQDGLLGSTTAGSGTSSATRCDGCSGDRTPCEGCARPDAASAPLSVAAPGVALPGVAPPRVAQSSADSAVGTKPRIPAPAWLQTDEALEVAAYLIQNHQERLQYVSGGLNEPRKQLLAVGIIEHLLTHAATFTYMCNYGVAKGRYEWVRPGPPEVIAMLLGIGPDDNPKLEVWGSV